MPVDPGRTGRPPWTGGNRRQTPPGTSGPSGAEGASAWDKLSGHDPHPPDRRMSSTFPPSGADGAGAPAQDEHDALPPGTRLVEFEILRVLGVGGFGIVYLAMDHALDRLVAVKEYMPSMMAARGRGTQVSLRSSLHQETFTIGLRSFVNEAKLLARFNHPSLVKVYRFWEANGTAYMAMPYYPGRTLKDERRSMAQVPSESWLRALVDPLLGAMEVLHREDVYHRDIAPDNILLLPEGPPVLLDFGAARSVIGDRTQSLTAVLKPSYAPIEQYADVGHLRQGAWTDLYALGAVLHFVVMGRPPTPSASRAVHDEQPLLSSLGPERTGSMPEKILKAIDWALTVSPHTRPQNVQQFRDALDGRISPPARTAHDLGPLRQEPSRAAPSGWGETLQVKEEGASAFSSATAAFADPPVPSSNGTGRVDEGVPAASTDDSTVVMPEAGGTSPASEAAPAPVPAPAAAPAPVPAAAPAAPPAAAPASAPRPQPQPVQADDQASRPRASRALPPLFPNEVSGDAGGHTHAVRMAMVLAAVAILALALAGWWLKDRFLAPAPAPTGVALPASPASAAAFPAPPSAPMVPPANPLDAAPAALQTGVTAAPGASVPDWSTHATRPGPPAAQATTASTAVQAGVPTASARPPRPARPAAAAAEPAASTPREVCNARPSGTMVSCVRRLCAQGPLYDHPQCVQQRREDDW